MNVETTWAIQSQTLDRANVETAEIQGDEELGRLFRFRIRIVSATTLDVDALLAEPAELVIRHGDVAQRSIFGRVREVGTLESLVAGVRAYELAFVPRTFRLDLQRTSEVFLDQSVPDLIREKLIRAGLEEGKDFELRLRASHAARDFVVQYKESDLAFVSRLCESAGITLVAEHGDDRDVLAFVDANAAFHRRDSAISYRPRGEERDVFHLHTRTIAVPRRVLLRDYNYRTPGVAITAEAEIWSQGEGEHLEYGGHEKSPDEAAAVARIRAEEILATRRTILGESTTWNLAAGLRARIEGTPDGDLDVLITAVRHRSIQPTRLASVLSECGYTNEFRAITEDTAFRPPRTTPKPRVSGSISGIVESPEGEEQYAHLDDSGRYRVRFFFDEAGSDRTKTSKPLRMAQPHAGSGYGFHFPLRHGAEVMLSCIDGDPDRPIITGALPHPTQPSPVGTSNAKRNIIRTGGGTEINIDDNEGLERFKVTTPYANTVLQLGAPNAPVSGAFLGTDEDAQIKAGQSLTLEALGEWAVLRAPDVEINAFGSDLRATAKALLYGSAPEIVFHADTQISGMSPKIELAALSEMTASAPTMKLDAGILQCAAKSQLSAASPTILVEGGATIAAQAPLLQMDATIFTAHGTAMAVLSGDGVAKIVSAGVVTIEAPGVTIAGPSAVNVMSGATVVISGGKVDIQGGTVSITGGTIELNK